MGPKELAADGCATVKEAAAFLGIGRTSIYEMVKAKKIRSVVLAGRRLVPRAELRRLVADELEGAESAK